MYGYAASSASATSLTPFNPPQQSTNPGGTAGQSAAVTQATGTAAGNAQSTIQQAFSSVPNALQSLATAAPAAATSAQAGDPLGTLSDLISIFLDAPSAIATFAADIPFGVIGVVALPLDVIGAGTGLHTDKIVSGWNGEEAWPGTGDQPPTAFPARITGPIGSSAATALSAGLGEANTVGALSVPPTWAVATPAVKPISYTLPALPETTVSAAAAPAAEAGSGSMLSEMALAGMAGRAMAGTVSTGASRTGKEPKGTRAAVRASEPATSGSAAAGDKDEAPEDKPRAVVTGVAAELREFAKLRDEGILTDEEYTEQKNRLLGR
jgi:PPE-repeat protein